MKCKKRNHVKKVKNIPRTWINEDGTVQFRIYVAVYCDTCKKQREKLNYKFRKFTDHRKVCAINHAM